MSITLDEKKIIADKITDIVTNQSLKIRNTNDLAADWLEHIALRINNAPTVRMSVKRAFEKMDKNNYWETLSFTADTSLKHPENWEAFGPRSVFHVQKDGAFLETDFIDFAGMRTFVRSETLVMFIQKIDHNHVKITIYTSLLSKK